MNPMMIVIGVVVVGFLAIGLSALVIQRRRKRFADLFYFDQQGKVYPVRGESFAGLVTHPDGGFMERSGAKLNMRYGQPLSELGDPGFRRKRKPVYLHRALDSAPLEFHSDGEIIVTNVSGEEFTSRQEMAAELALAEAASRAGGTDIINLSLGATLVLLALSTAAIGAAVAAKGAF